jgi:adenine phosphoribosyltransferase
VPDKGFGVQVPVRTRLVSRLREVMVVATSAPFSNEDFDLAPLIEGVPDYPKPGILFKDITPLLANGTALAITIDRLAHFFRQHKSDAIAGIEARGFILGAAVASTLGIGFLPLRKPGKSPRPVHSVRYALEYGEDELQVHRHLLEPGMRIGIIDDVLATGGTAAASIDLIGRSGAEAVGFACLLELGALGGRKRILEKSKDLPIHALIVQ